MVGSGRSCEVRILPRAALPWYPQQNRTIIRKHLTSMNLIPQLHRHKNQIVLDEHPPNVGQCGIVAWVETVESLAKPQLSSAFELHV